MDHSKWDGGSVNNIGTGRVDGVGVRGFSDEGYDFVVASVLYANDLGYFDDARTVVDSMKEWEMWRATPDLLRGVC